MGVSVFDEKTLIQGNSFIDDTTGTNWVPLCSASDFSAFRVDACWIASNSAGTVEVELAIADHLNPGTKYPICRATVPIAAGWGGTPMADLFALALPTGATGIPVNQEWGLYIRVTTGLTSPDVVYIYSFGGAF